MVRRTVTPTAPTFGKRPPEKVAFPAESFYQIVAIASSTGGPSALLKILQDLPPNLPAGVLIVQHISQGFTQGLVEWLQREINLKVRVAHNDDRVTPGTVFLAPDRMNMVVKPYSDFRIGLNSDGEEYIRPNADILLNSVARVYAERAIGIVLTGMGSDGANGLKEMSRYGAQTIAQDEATSLIYGMPKAATENGAARQVIPLGQMANAIIKLLQQPAQ
jgi:two-component system chemotaxis response regulator CheB